MKCRALLLLMLAFVMTPAQAIITGELIMVRSDNAFVESMGVLQDAIKRQGYRVSRVQSVDTGLTQSGYKTDKYRIVFFGKTEEIDNLTNNYPDLIPYLPLKLVIYAEAGETLLVTMDPGVFIDLFPYPQLQQTFKQWQQDVIVIMKTVQDAGF